MKKMKYNIILVVGFVTTVAQAQNTEHQIVVNTGVMFVSPNETLATHFDFSNTKEGQVVNDGTVYFFGNFNNDGQFSFSKKGRTSANGTTIFSRYGDEVGVQLISGNAITDFFNVELDNKTPQKAFDLKNNIDVYGVLHFNEGILKVDETINPEHDSSYGMLTFQQGAKAVNTSNLSYAEGKVEKIGSENFEYPIGDQLFYRPAAIGAPDNILDAVVAEYKLNDTAFFAD